MPRLKVSRAKECIDFFHGRIALAPSKQAEYFAKKHKDKLSNHPTFSYIAATELYISSFPRKQQREFLNKGREIRQNLTQFNTSS
jgi:hypothetical protein